MQDDTKMLKERSKARRFVHNEMQGWLSKFVALAGEEQAIKLLHDVGETNAWKITEYETENMRSFSTVNQFDGSLGRGFQAKWNFGLFFLVDLY